MADDTIMIRPNTQRRVLSAPLRFCFFAKIETRGVKTRKTMYVLEKCLLLPPSSVNKARN